jgi:hypothetical protein
MRRLSLPLLIDNKSHSKDTLKHFGRMTVQPSIRRPCSWQAHPRVAGGCNLLYRRAAEQAGHDPATLKTCSGGHTFIRRDSDKNSGPRARLSPDLRRR